MTFTAAAPDLIGNRDTHGRARYRLESPRVTSITEHVGTRYEQGDRPPGRPRRRSPHREESLISPSLWPTGDVYKRQSKLPHDFYDTSIDVTKAQNAIKPEAIALGVLGLIAGLAAIVIAGQVIGRQLGFWAPEELSLIHI